MKTPTPRLVPLLAAALLAAGCSSLNPFASSGPKPAALVDFKPAAQLVAKWQANIGDAEHYRFQPAVWSDSVYAAGNEGEVARFEDGRALWRIDTGSELSAGVGTDGRLAVVVATDGTVIALDTDNGSERWRAPIGAEVLAPPRPDVRLVIVRASDNRLIALNARDGSRRWVYQRNNPPLALRSFAGVVLEGPVVLAGFPGGKLIAVATSNGAAVWDGTVAVPKGATELDRVADITSAPVISGRSVCAVAFQGRVACFDLGSGNLVWARDMSSAAGLDVDSRFLYVSDDKGAVHALDMASGASIWKQDKLSLRRLTAPVARRGYVAVADAEGIVHFLSREDGSFIARLETDGSPVVAPPQKLGNGVLVQTSEGGLYAIEAE